MNTRARAGHTESIEYLRLSANVKLSMLYQETIQPDYKAPRGELQLKHQKTKPRVIELPGVLDKCFGLIYLEKEVSTEAKFQFLSANPFVMSAYAPPFRPTSPKKATKLAHRICSENPEDNEEPRSPSTQKVGRQSGMQIPVRSSAGLVEFELQARCVRMVDDLLDDDPVGANKVSNYREALLKFQ